MLPKAASPFGTIISAIVKNRETQSLPEPAAIHSAAAKAFGAQILMPQSQSVFVLADVHKIFILDSKNFHFSNTETSFLMHIIRP